MSGLQTVESMNLRTKLFLSVGSVLLFVCILSYVLPNFLLQSDLQKLAAKIKPQEKSSVLPLVAEMQHTAVKKISLTLLGASFIGLAIGLIFLARIAGRVTKPIVLLAKATEEMEKGRYENIVLPTLGDKTDEISTLSHGFEKMVLALKDREKIRGVLNKVVSKEVASEILKSRVELGGEERVVTILFSDIRGFTKMTENIQPRTLITLMNTYLSEMCHIIDEQGGVVDKFVGDEVMALYGAPLECQDQAIKAITSALWMVKSLKNTNEKRDIHGLPHVEIGIGIHTGNVVAGNVGSETRLNYTVLGANVNLASRLCSVAKGMQILVSEETLKAPFVQETYLYEELAPVSLKGIATPVKIFEIKGFL